MTIKDLLSAVSDTAVTASSFLSNTSRTSFYYINSTLDVYAHNQLVHSYPLFLSFSKSLNPCCYPRNELLGMKKDLFFIHLRSRQLLIGFSDPLQSNPDSYQYLRQVDVSHWAQDEPNGRLSRQSVRIDAMCLHIDNNTLNSIQTVVTPVSQLTRFLKSSNYLQLNFFA